jgi:hypothetical protein
MKNMVDKVRICPKDVVICENKWEEFIQNSDQLQSDKEILTIELWACSRSIPMAVTGHHFTNKFQRKSFLLNMEEKLAP